jgi:hypothetical protein
MIQYNIFLPPLYLSQVVTLKLRTSLVKKHQKIKSKADYINNHILNVFKYIFNIELIIKFQSDFLNE